MSNSVDNDKKKKDGAPKTIRVLIVGAGPGGLLAAINLLRRNEDVPKTKTRYQVTLVDPGVDYGKLDEKGLSRFRSWMIGLSSHGLTSIREIPGLYEDYVEKLGVRIRLGTIGMGPTFKYTEKIKEEDLDTVGFCVDRNYVCGALARYLDDNFENVKTEGSGSDFVPLYNTRVLFVDGDNRRVMIRSTKSNEDKVKAKRGDEHHDMTALEYDVLLGCDGIRSVVRNAFLTNHRDFEFDIQGNFGVGKAVHLNLPPDVEEGNFMMLFNCVPNVTSFILPERGRQINVGFGWNKNQKVDPVLLSDDPAAVSAYLKQNFKQFDMDHDEFGKKWVEQDWTEIQFAHCNFYHSMKLRALLLGDAAHATVPNIGQGMNTAFADASALNKLLDEYHDDWDEVLPAFSKERVKEGNALSELSFHTFSIDPSMMMSITIRQNAHRFFNKFLPEWILEKEPMVEVSKGMKLSVAYDKVSKYGYLKKSRQINNDIRRDYFERQVGMIRDDEGEGKFTRFIKTTTKIGFVTVFVAGISYAIQSNRRSK